MKTTALDPSMLIAGYWWTHVNEEEEDKKYEDISIYRRIQENKTLKLIYSTPKHILLLIYRQLHRGNDFRMEGIDGKIDHEIHKAFESQKP